MKLYKNLCKAVIGSLKEVFVDQRYADKVIEYTLKKNPKWGARDRKFIAETTYEMVRWWRLLHEISGLNPRQFQDISEISDYYSDKILWHLFGAWCAINHIELPPWDELKDIEPEKILSGFDEAKSVRKIRESIPDWMDEMGSAELGEENWEREIHSLNEEAKVALRTNTLKISPGELRKRLSAQDIETELTEFSPESLILKKRQNIFHLPEFKEGLFEVQDAASQAVAPFLKAEPGMRVIDACAGAGGKTLHLASLMENKGKIIALDTEPWKLEELRRRARRAGAANIEPKLIDSTKTIKRLYGSADRLLLDVPCSGSGVLKRNPDAKWKLSPAHIQKLREQQEEILNNYSPLLRKGGLLVYATCSIFPSENEKQLEKFLLDQKGNFTLVEEKRIFPSQGFDGFYMAALKKF